MLIEVGEELLVEHGTIRFSRRRLDKGRIEGLIDRLIQTVWNDHELHRLDSSASWTKYDCATGTWPSTLALVER